MAKKNMKMMGRKALSLLLTLSMVTGMMQVPAMAAFSNQVMDGYFVIDENGNQSLAGEGITSVTEDGFTLTKSIEQTGKDEFEITLRVETSQTVTTSDAAIQLVIDNSSSMEQCADCGEELREEGKCYDKSHTRKNHRNICDTCGLEKGKDNSCDVEGHTHTRLDAIQDILTRENGFLDSLTTANTGAVYVSVVKFDRNAHKVSDWVDIKDADNLEDVKDDINAITNGNGTNIHGGLLLGYNRLGMDEVANAGSRYMVLLSDGAPYAHAEKGGMNNLSSTEIIYGTDFGTHDTPAVEIAEEIRNDGGITLYTVGYGTAESENELLEDIAGSSERAFGGSDSAAIKAAFANIAMSAVNGMNGAGTSVTDPMGKYIVLGDVSDLEGEGVEANGNGIAWELDPAKAEKIPSGDTTTYVYSVTYPITLDTAAEGFEENTDYPTNGYTYLSVPQENGPAKKIAFLVPGVFGEIPEVSWKIEYYLQTEDSINDEFPSYELEETDPQGDVKVWTSVSAPEGYADKYSEDNYKFASGDTLLVISADEEQNVMRLYYDLITVPVTVNHYYKTDVITRDGEEIPGEYPAEPNKTGTEFTVVGELYEAETQLIYGDIQYTFDYANPESKKLHAQQGSENVIDLFYTRVDDQRIRTSAQVDHVYTLYTYELDENGIYQLEESSSIVEEKVQYSEELPATSVYAVSAEPVSARAEYTINPEKGDYEQLLQDDDSLSFILKEAAEDNVRTLYFDKVEDNREKATVTVEHYYTNHVTAIENGEVVHSTDPNNELGFTDVIEVYAGERFVAEEIKMYEGKKYESDADNANRLVIDEVEGGEVIKLHYIRSQAPEKVQVVGNHYWRSFVEAIVELTEEVVDEATGESNIYVIGYDTEIRVNLDHSVEGITYNDLYEGQMHIEMPQIWGEGYEYNSEESIPVVYAGENVEAMMYYDKYDEQDERREAAIQVRHSYTTYWTTVVDGEVQTLTITADPVEESYAGKAGEEFVAVAQPVYEGNEYTQITDDSELSVILQPGLNATIVIHYEREFSDLVETAYSVDYEYRTYTMTINESGAAGYWDEPEVITDAAEGAGYVGQKIVLDDKALDGFVPSQTNPALTQVLKGEDNHWSFLYSKYIPLDAGSVVVNHHYKTVTIAVNGTESENTQSVYGTPVSGYIGESYSAQAVLNGFEQTGVNVDEIPAELAGTVAVTVGDRTVIDFYYEKVVDLSVPVTYSIAHEYYLYDWDGSLISESKPDPVVGTGFATNQLVVAPEVSDYTLTSATYNGDEMDSYTIILQEGENAVVFVYEKTQPRDFVDAAVIHNYYQDEAAMLAEDAQPQEQFIENKSNLPEGSEFYAQEHEKSGYVFYSADPDSMSITLSDSGENVIVINYIRAAASYEIVHIYNVNGQEEGRTSETREGLDGDIITADSITRVNEYEGRYYTFEFITDDIVLSAEAEELPAIIVHYNRTVYIPSDDDYGDDDYEPVPKPQPEPDPVPEIEPEVEPELPEVEIPEIEIPEIEIPEEEVPLAALPEEEELVEIPDEDTPLADVPRTGEQSAPFAVMALVSGVFLACLSIFKKREDELV